MEWKGIPSGPAPESLNGITEETDESAEWTDGQGDDFGAEDFGRDWEVGWEGRDYNEDYNSNDHRPTATAPKKPTRDRRPDSEQALSEKKCNRCSDFMTVKESTQKSGTCNRCHHGSTRRSRDTHDATPRTHDYQGKDTNPAVDQ